MYNQYASKNKLSLPCDNSRESETEPRRWGHRNQTGLRGKIWENGKITAGVVPCEKIRQEDREYDRDYAAQHDTAIIPTRDYNGFRIEEQVYFIPERSQAIIEQKYSPQDSDDISLSSPINSHRLPRDEVRSPRTPRGQNGLTSYGKNMIQNGCYRLEQIYSRKRLAFGTITLPSLSEDYLLLLISDWSELARQFLQQLDRELIRHSPKSKGHFIGVTEIQPERMEKSGIPCPHLHFVYPAHAGDWNWWVSADRMRQIWASILSARLARWIPADQLPEINCRAAVNTQRLKKSASKEMGKYLSKGSCIKKIKDSGYIDFLPSAWWHCGRILATAIKKHIIPCPVNLLTAIRQKIDLVGRGLCEYFYTVERDGKVFGWSGKLTDLGNKFFRNSS